VSFLIVLLIVAFALLCGMGGTSYYGD